VRARHLTVTPAPSWLPEGTGFALEPSAPRAVFSIPTGRTATIRTVEGRFRAQALDDVTALGALPRRLAQPAAVRELRFERRSEAYTDWTLRRQRGAESRLVCQKDRLPEPAAVALSDFVPFLSLHESAAAR
jgi:hypothetical protein